MFSGLAWNQLYGEKICFPFHHAFIWEIHLNIVELDNNIRWSQFAMKGALLKWVSLNLKIQNNGFLTILLGSNKCAWDEFVTAVSNGSAKGVLNGDKVKLVSPSIFAFLYCLKLKYNLVTFVKWHMAVDKMKCGRPSEIGSILTKQAASKPNAQIGRWAD